METKGIKVAEKKTCKEKQHDNEIVHIGSFFEHEGVMAQTFYCRVCNCTWTEL